MGDYLFKGLKNNYIQVIFHFLMYNHFPPHLLTRLLNIQFRCPGKEGNGHGCLRACRATHGYHDISLFVTTNKTIVKG